MKSKWTYMVAAVATACLLSACGSNAAREAAQEMVDAYNEEVSAYNEKAAVYNETVQAIAAANSELQSVIDAAQDALNRGEDPYDEETETDLKAWLAEAASEKADTPEEIPIYENLSVDENASSSELTALTEEASEKLDELVETEIPSTPGIPDYTDIISELQGALDTYENSIQSLKQVTAPGTDFVIERLQTIETILEIEAVTDEHDPNGLLNKQGGYIGCIYFSDTQVDWSKLYIADGEDDVISVGTIGGGCIEIFASVEEAETRDTYLGAFDGTILATGSHYIVGTVLIRVSDELTGTQQLELTELITNALIEVK